MSLSSLLRQAFNEVSAEHKAHVVASIEQANSPEYQRQVAEYHLVNKVIDDMLQDPFWVDLIKEVLESRGS